MPSVSFRTYSSKDALIEEAPNSLLGKKERLCLTFNCLNKLIFLVLRDARISQKIGLETCLTKENFIWAMWESSLPTKKYAPYEDRSNQVTKSVSRKNLWGPLFSFSQSPITKLLGSSPKGVSGTRPRKRICKLAGWGNSTCREGNGNDVFFLWNTRIDCLIFFSSSN